MRIGVVRVIVVSEVIEQTDFLFLGQNPEKRIGIIEVNMPQCETRYVRFGLDAFNNVDGADIEGGRFVGCVFLIVAKWDTRRMLGDLGHDIETSVFGIIEMAYTNGPINRLNYKGIIKSDSTKRAIRPKIAYYAIQNVTSIFDQSLQRIRNVAFSHNKAQIPTDKTHIVYTKSTDRSLAVYAYQHKDTKKQLYTIWADDHIPIESTSTRNLTFTFANGTMDQPVYVDIITGGVYEIPAGQWTKAGDQYTFTNIPIYDAPILIADKSLVTFQ